MDILDRATIQQAISTLRDLDPVLTRLMRQEDTHTRINRYGLNMIKTGSKFMQDNLTILIK